MASIREVAAGTQEQGEDEIIIYTIDTANYGGSPVSPTAVVKDVTDSFADVTSTVMPTNVPTVSTDTITLSPLKLLTLGKTYRVEIKYTKSGNTLEPYFEVRCKR